MKEIYRIIHGSNLYNLNTPESDIDYKSIYIQDYGNLLSNNIIPQTNFDKDNVGWEISRFLELLFQYSPTVIESLFAPASKIITYDGLLDPIFLTKAQFLTKKTVETFINIAKSQIKKGTAIDKKVNWGDFKRLNPIDFCYVIVDLNRDMGLTTNPHGVIKLSEFLNFHKISPSNLIISKLNHSKECFNLYLTDKTTKGITADDSNALRLSEVPEGEYPFATLIYNADAYSVHCGKWKEYSTWLKERNENRIKYHEKSGQSMDSKNMMHCIRYLDIAEQILTTKNINLTCDQSKREYLLSIKHAEIPPSEVLTISNEKIALLTKQLETTKLPLQLDPNLEKLLLLKIRTNYYQ